MNHRFFRMLLALTCVMQLAFSIRIASADEPKKETPETKPLKLIGGTLNIDFKDGKSELAGSTVDPKIQLEREKAFSELMSGAVLEGNFTMRGKENGKLPTPEKYTLGKVTKVKDDTWLFETRIQYGKHDMTLPLPIRVVWSGDTPVITLDKMMVPGFGTFTCRVMIFNNQYAGMWDSDSGKSGDSDKNTDKGKANDHGGLLFGKITKPVKESK